MPTSKDTAAALAEAAHGPTLPATLAESLVALQADMPHVGSSREADTGTYRYRYAGLHDVAEALYPALVRVGLAFTATPTLTDGRFVLDYRLHHWSGEWIGGQYPLADPTRATGQQIGSSITYARRYALSAVTGLVIDPDDDGAQAPEAPRVAPVTADPVWLERMLERIALCDTAGVLKGLKAEGATQVQAGRVAPEDVQRLRDAFAACAERLFAGQPREQAAEGEQAP